MDREAEFNRTASDELIMEYERETGCGLSFKELGRPFPDVILERSDGSTIGVEFVSVVLPFVRQEEVHFGRYRQRLYELLKSARPRYKNVAIRLQPSSQVVEEHRPFKLPNVDSPEGKQLITELHDLLTRHFDVLVATHGGLIERFSSGGGEYQTVLEYFGAIILTRISIGDPRTHHPEDPVIGPIVVWYSSAEIARAVRRALGVKAAKGQSYATDFLVLHTLKAPGKPYFEGPAMDATEIKTLGRALLAEGHDVCQRFSEIWFLNAYWTEGRRLYRLK